VPWRAVAAGVALQIALALLFLKVRFVKDAFPASCSASSEAARRPSKSRTRQPPSCSRFVPCRWLCGFAIFGSLGITLGGLGTMCPQRRGEVLALGLKSVVAGVVDRLHEVQAFGDSRLPMLALAWPG
jgi:nucleoside permease NupC